MTESLQSFHYGLCWAHQSTNEKTVVFVFRQETKAIIMYQEREVYFYICGEQSLPLSPGLPGWPGLPGNPCMPGDPCSPCGPGAPGRPGSPGGPVMVRVETDWLGIWFRIELYLAIWPVKKKVPSFSSSSGECGSAEFEQSTGRFSRLWSVMRW